MNQATPPTSALDAILAQTRHLLFDFDAAVTTARPATGRTAPGALVTDQAHQPAPCGWREFLAWYGRWPGSYRPTRVGVATGHEYRRGWPRALPFPARIPPVSGRPEEPLTVIRPPEVPIAGAKKDVLRTRAPGALIVAAVTRKAAHASQMVREKLTKERRQIGGPD